MSFRDLSKLTLTALETSKSIPKHLEANVVHFSHNTDCQPLFTQSCDENKLTPMCFFLLHDQILWLVSQSYPHMIHLALYIRFIYIT